MSNRRQTVQNAVVLILLILLVATPQGRWLVGQFLEGLAVAGHGG